jgi:hypothetical protein
MSEEDFVGKILKEVRTDLLPNQTVDEALERAAAARFRKLSDAALMILVRAINREAKRRLARDKRAVRNQRRATDVKQE